MLDFVEFQGATLIHRRSFLTLGAAAMASTRIWGLANLPMPTANTAVEEKLDTYTATYMRAMNAPGLTLALTDAATTLRTAAYGLSNVELKTPLTPSHLFQIGSITKSFAALILMQLHDEGKLDLHRPILEYLPWLPLNMPYGPITSHHLLTHTSGLPDAGALFQSAPDARHQQGFAPGTHFHYCNLGFSLLGQLIEHLDQKPWYQALQARILTPMDMNATAGVITIASSAQSATGYQSYYDDAVYPRQGRLTPRPPEVFDNPAGSIAAPPADMARYLRMLLNGGKGPHGRIVSSESFALFSTPYIKAAELSPTAFYGYGIATDTLDGHKILRHTGGMNCFASSMHVDLDGGYAAFASINAMQGYRPTAITQYAVQLLRAEKAKPLPQPEPLPDPQQVENAADYAGHFRTADGRALVIKTQEKRLLLIHNGEDIPLQRSEGDTFVSTRQGTFSLYSLAFGRDTPENKSPIVELSYGPDWYINDQYKGPRDFPEPAAYSAFVGHYRSEGGEDARVFIRKGRLYVGDSLLSELGSALFRIGEEPWSPDTVEFLAVFNNKARLLRVIDDDCWRIEVG